MTEQQFAYLPWERLDERGTRPCVRDDRMALTYTELAERVDSFAAQLADRGIGRGDVIAVMLPNRVELLVALMAAWRLGAAATPINPVFTQTEAAYQIDDAGSTLVVNEGPDAPTAGRPVIHADAISTAPADDAGTFDGPAADDLALLIYTSGSTGRPKGVELTHANLRFMAESLAERLALTADDHCLLILPLFHVNAICVSVLAPMVRDAQVSVTGRFSPQRFFDDVTRLRPTYFSAVPTIYALLVSRADEFTPDFSSLRFAVCGAAPISAELLDPCRAALRAADHRGLRAHRMHLRGDDQPARRPAQAGHRRHRAARRAGRRGRTSPVRPLPAGEAGEVVISGPNVMRGYLGRAQETAATIVEGWLHTGDVGRLDDDGYLTLVDRIKDMIIRGGENIYPKEIENALATHPVVLEAAVIGRPDATYGELPVAFVQTYPGAQVTADDLIEHLRPQLTKIKLPVAVHLVEALPRNPVGKIDKPALRAQLTDA